LFTSQSCVQNGVPRSVRHANGTANGVGLLPGLDAIQPGGHIVHEA